MSTSTSSSANVAPLDDEITTDASPSKKKRRLQNACDKCRERKVRCDSSEMPDGICSNCLSIKAKCTHVAKRKKRGPKIGAPSHTAIKALIATILSEAVDPFTIPEDPNAIRSIIVDLANYARTLEKELIRSRRRETFATISSFQDADSGSVSGTGASAGASPSNLDDVPDDADSDYSETDALIEQFSNVELSRAHNRHFGKSSSAMFFLTLFDFKKLDIKKRTEFWTPFPWQLQKHWEPQSIQFDFPEKEHLETLIDVYFTQHNSHYLLLHRSTFERSVAEGLHLGDRCFGSLLLAVCAIASRICGDPQSLPEQPCSNLGLGWRWFKQLTLVRTAFKDPITLYELQTYCLAVVFLQTTILSDSAWVLNGFAIRLAQERGIHRRKNPDSKPTLERELWKRAFWNLVVTDMFGSCAFGRPRATSSDDFDIEPLIECGEEAWDNPEVDVSTLPFSKTSPAAFWNCFMRLVEITAFCQRALYPIKTSELTAKMGVSTAKWNEKVVIELDSALNSWMDTIPRHLKWDPHCENETYFAQSVILHAVYYFTQIQVHRSFIPKLGEKSKQSSFPSMAICVNAARSALHVIDCHFQRRRDWTTAVILAALFNSSTVLLYNLYRGRELKINTDPQRGLADVMKCTNILRAWEERHQLAGRLHDNFLIILNLRVSPMAEAAPSTKRRRDEESHVDENATHEALSTYYASSSSSNAQILPTSSTIINPNDPNLIPSEYPGYSDHFTSDSLIYGSGFGHAQGQLFTLPFFSSELGSLPVYEPFRFDEQSNSGALLQPSLAAGISTGNTSSDWEYDARLGGSQYTSSSEPASVSSFHGTDPLGDSYLQPWPGATDHDNRPGDSSQQQWDMFMAGLDQLFS